MADEEPSYIDYEAFLDPTFSPISFANKLVLATNDPSEATQDLSTPLSKVLFDVQEIDTHIDTLTTKSALPLLQYTQTRANASQRILDEVEGQVATLNEAYRVLQKDVVERYEAAEQVRIVADRLCRTVRLARGVSRSLLLGRQLQVQMAEYTGSGAKKGGDFKAMVRSANTLATTRVLLQSSKPGEEGHGLDRVNVITSLKTDLLIPAERLLLARAQQSVKEFSMSSLVSSNVSSQSTASAPTFSQNEETKSRVVSALLTLYLLSPVKDGATLSSFEPTLVISSLQEYLQTALKSSLAALTRSLATLPTLDRTLAEVSARCQNIIALESLLSSISPPAHPGLTTEDTERSNGTSSNFLQPLLQSLDTSSLPSYFWRSLASNLSPRVQEILSKGGVSARTLRANKDRVREAVRTCVDRGSQLPGSAGRRRGAGMDGRSWEREAAVMVGAIIGPISR
jgi:hypothetical protein